VLLPFYLALAASLALHLGVLLSPGWDLPVDDTAAPLDARLVPAPPVAVAPVGAVAPPRPHPVRRPRPATPPATSAATAEAPVAAVEPPAAPPDESHVAAAEPAAVPPAPTIDGPAETAPDAVPAAATPEVVGIAQRWPRAGRIVYQVLRAKDGFVLGRSEHRWTHDGVTYQLHAEVETTGIVALFRKAKVIQESTGVIDPAGLHPVEFLTRRDERTPERVRFDTTDGRIWLGNSQSVAYDAAAQDLLSLIIQLALLAFEDGTRFPLTIATTRKVATYHVVVGSEQPLATPLGTLTTRHLTVTGDAADEEVTEVWIDLTSRMPVKIRHRDRRGDVYDQLVDSIEVETQP